MPLSRDEIKQKAINLAKAIRQTKYFKDEINNAILQLQKQKEKLEEVIYEAEGILAVIERDE